MAHELPTRRQVLQAAASIGVAVATAHGAQQGQPATARAATEPAQPYFYVDGYHGGVDGHMPADSLKNVMDGLDRTPHWKVSFEIEPYSWAVFAKRDPDSIGRLRRFLDDDTAAARVELVSGAYGQPYAWNINGESNIRHLLYGRDEIRAVFPKVRVDTYAVQEPCWTSCLPQLLKSFGYRRAVLKNSTCWGGYHANTLDADLVNWVGPDGSSIVAVPRYACEKLVNPATEENAQPTADYIARCRAAGIAHPAGTILQDMGWPGRPWRLGIKDEVLHAFKHVTWREYVDTIASPAAKDWKVSQEDMRGALAWGASILQRIAQVVRIAENQLLQAEKIASMAKARSGTPFPAADLSQAWTLLLKSQHHDVWITPYNHRPGGTWASEADARCATVAETCKKIIQDSAAAMTVSPAPVSDAAQVVRVFNTTGSRRRDIASFDVAAGSDRRSFVARDAQGRAASCQLVPGEAGAPATVLFAADVPAMGYATYKVFEVTAPPEGPDHSRVAVTTLPNGAIVLETDLYTLSIDPAKGGKITSLVSKELHREFVDRTSPRGFNEFRGFFPNDGKWLSSVDAPAAVTIKESGPVRVRVQIRGKIGEHPFTTNLSLGAGQRRIDFHTTFEFPVDGPTAARDGKKPKFRVGETWEPGHDVTRSNRRPFYDSSYKLQALFPTPSKDPTLYKNAAFDVCRSTQEDTRFNAWDAIKHNVIVNWVDLVDGDGSAGLAVMSDHTTAYSFGAGEPLGLVMCYAGPGNWFDYTLGRAPSVSYSLVPHAGDWAAGKLWRELGNWSEPLIARATSETPAADVAWSLIDAGESGIEVTTLFEHEDQSLIRLFNAAGDATPKEITLATNVQKAELVELDGRVISELQIHPHGPGLNSVTLAMPRFGVQTLRVKIAPSATVQPS